MTVVDWHLRERFDSACGEVAWDRFGELGAEPVVLLHGTPWSSFTWRTIATTLAGCYEVYVWDMPGYGESAKYSGQNVSIGAQAQVFAELLVHWGLTDPLVVAHDIGGAVALRAHLLHAAPYRKLALIDPVAVAPWGSPFFRLVSQHSDVFTQLPPALHRALVREYVASASATGLYPPTLDKLIEPWLGEDGQPAFYRQIAQAHQLYTDEIQDRYSSITIPVLICWGSQDTWLPVARAHELAATIPGATLRLVDSAGHLVQEDAPAQLTEALLTFFAGERRDVLSAV